MHRRTRKLQFSQAERRKIITRDNGECIFCAMGYRPSEDKYLLPVREIMHFIPRSAGGLGVERNGAVGCKYHHMMLDNGSRGERTEMLALFEKYLRGKYPDWKKEALIYRKYEFQEDSLCL